MREREREREKEREREFAADAVKLSRETRCVVWWIYWSDIWGIRHFQGERELIRHFIAAGGAPRVVSVRERGRERGRRRRRRRRRRSSLIITRTT